MNLEKSLIQEKNSSLQKKLLDTNLKLKNKIYITELTIFILIAFLFISQLNYFNKKNENDLQKNVNNIIQITKYDIEQLIEDIYNKHNKNKKLLENIHEYTQNEFIKNQNIKLEELHKKVVDKFDLEDMYIDIYLINKDYIITESTFKKDIGFNLNFTDDSKEYLNKTKKDSKIYVASNISIDLWDSNLNIYSYSKINDELYFEMGFKFNNKIYKPLQSKLSSIYKNTKNKVTIYRIMDTSDGKEIYHSIFDDKSKLNMTKSEYEKSLIKYDKNKVTSNNYINSVRSNKIIQEQVDNNMIVYIPLLNKESNKFLTYNNILMEIEFDISTHLELVYETKQFFYLYGILLGILFLSIYYFINYKFYKPMISILKCIESEEKITNKDFINSNNEFGLLAKNYNKLYDSMTNQVNLNVQLLDDNKRFIADAIHQARTPLTNIVMNTEMLKESKIDSDAKEYIDHIEASTIMLSNTYEDFSYLSTFNIIKYKPYNISLSSVLKLRIKNFNIISKVHNKIIVQNIEENLSFYINTIELERIIDNNISNAIKYGDNNKDIYINLNKIDGFIILEFKSHGKPIKNKNKIFEKNYRENESKRGLGLGLNIVKNICEKYDIKYRVNSFDGVNIFTYEFKIF
jgi:signal transduction histidine kinase